MNIVNEQPEDGGLDPNSVFYYRTYNGRLIRFYPGEGSRIDQADLDFDSYMYSGYVQNNPGYINERYSSYVGIYISDRGEYSGTWIANTQVEQFG